jgi:hypothetical protein
MRPEPRRTAERLGLDQGAIRWLEVHGHLQRLALSEPEIRARLYHAHLAHLLPRTIPGPAPREASTACRYGLS